MQNALYYIAVRVETVIKRHNRGNGKSNTIAPPHNNIPITTMTIKRRRADHKGKRQAVQRRCLCPLGVSFLSFRFVAAGAGLRREAAHLLYIKHPPQCHSVIWLCYMLVKTVCLCYNDYTVIGNNTCGTGAIWQMMTTL